MTIVAVKHQLPPLPFPAAALEPHIDARTVLLHHDKHHAGYVDTLNKTLESAPESVQGNTAMWLLLNLDKIPEKIRTTVKNNAGGHVNHSLLWQSMRPPGGSAPSDSLAAAINNDFGDLAKFKTQFEEAGSKLFGSGWVWLVKGPRNEGLKVMTTTGHDNPVTQGCFVLLVNDVWEHAYYLKYENRRSEYLHQWWSIANWAEAARRFKLSQQPGQSPAQLMDQV